LVNEDHVRALLEDADSGGSELDFSAGGLCWRSVAENRAGGADGKPATGTQ